MRSIIAIVGRPNVGKSTLFNRIVGRRQAIVNATSGVTRDRHYADADWCGHQFVMIDTGGLAEGDDKSIQLAIKRQALTAIDEADIIICLFDGREGPTVVDKSIVELLRKSGKNVIYAVNKMEDGRRKMEDGRVSEFYELGIKNLIAISAEHGIGVDSLLDKILDKWPPPPAPSPLPPLLRWRAGEGEGWGEGASHAFRIAVIGRPNAGKSTLINRLAGTERVIVHEIPGTTRDTIDIEIAVAGKKYIFVDTAGLKKKGKTIGALDKFSAIKTLGAIKRVDIVLLVVDSNEGFTHQDRALLDHAYSEGKGLIILFNKWDALNTDPKILKEFYAEKLLKLHRVPFLCISAKTGEGMDKIFKDIEKISYSMMRRLSTSELNRALEGFKASHNMPSFKGAAVKLYYITQAKSSPPTFLIFSNHPDGVKESYKKYLVNRMQDMVGDGVPIRIKFMKK